MNLNFIKVMFFIKNNKIVIFYFFFILFSYLFFHDSAYSQNVGDKTKKECIVQRYIRIKGQCYASKQCIQKTYRRRNHYQCPLGYEKSAHVSFHSLIVTCFNIRTNQEVHATTIPYYNWESSSEYDSMPVSSNMCSNYNNGDNDDNNDEKSNTCPNVKVKINGLPSQFGTAKLKCNTN